MGPELMAAEAGFPSVGLILSFPLYFSMFETSHDKNLEKEVKAKKPWRMKTGLRTASQRHCGR